MSDLNPRATKIKLGGKEYGMRFTLNAIDDIQDHFDIPISELFELFNDEKKNIKALRYLLTLLINEDIDAQNDRGTMTGEYLTERYVGRYIDSTNMVDVMNAVLSTFSGSLPDGDESPNAPAGQTD
jgi:hypothetical protein